MKLKVAIIDDEKHAIDTLTYDLLENHSDEVEILFSSTNPLEGAKYLRTMKPDLLFLDVDMPGMTGLDLIQLIEDLFIQVVFTTAHLEYAIQAVETIASGYLLKPVQAEELKRMLEKVKKEKQTRQLHQPAKGRIAIPDADGIELVPWEEIIYCKSDSNYCELNLTGNRKMVASKTLKYFEAHLPSSQFIRVHKSYLINLQHIKKYLKREGGELLMSNGKGIPVSRNSREEILKRLQ